MLFEYDVIYLSPHLDDVTLSCGGQVFKRTYVGETVLIVTVMAGDPPSAKISDFAQRLHNRWHLSLDATLKRRIEDQAACGLLGADYVHWPLPDCIYRKHPTSNLALYDSEEAIFGRVHPVEMDLVQQLSKRITSLPKHKALLIPLGVGNHVDHQLTRLAAEQDRSQQSLIYYEDYPYTREEAALESILHPRNLWQSEVIRLSETDLAAKVHAIACYESQLGSFFHDEEDLAQQVKGHHDRIGGERNWHRL
jgi:LmbE family N-acetylglucosaminyl deacetylase